MAIGYFIEKNHTPSQEEIGSALGTSAPLWQELSEFIRAQYQIPGELTFGGKNYGWNCVSRLASCCEKFPSFMMANGCLFRLTVLRRCRIFNHSCPSRNGPRKKNKE